MHKDFEGLLSVFNAHSVRYLIVGGYAVSFHAEKNLEAASISPGFTATKQMNAAKNWQRPSSKMPAAGLLLEGGVRCSRGLTLDVVHHRANRRDHRVWPINLNHMRAVCNDLLLPLRR